MRTIDIKFSELCDEIDYWKSVAHDAEKKYNELRKEYSKLTYDNLISSQKGVADALMLALSIRDDENGNIIIDKKSRKNIADRFKES
jgi:hypothetical protein